MPTSKEISGLHIKPVDLQDPVLFRLNQNFDFLAQLILKSQGQISSISATLNSLLGTSGLLTGLHADRVVLPASANQLTLYWEQDRDALYVSIDISGTWTWAWIYDSMRDLFANRPADLGTSDTGFTFEDTTPGYTYLWNGATWDVVEVLTDLVTIVKSGGDAPEYVRSYGGIPRVIFQQAAGTSAAPTKTVSGAPIMQLGGRGYEQVTPGFAADDRVAIVGKASQDWTAAAQGTQITLEATPTGSTTRGTAVTIKDSSGVWGLGLGGAPFDAVYGGTLRVTAASFPSGLAASFDTVASTIYVNVCAKSGGIIRTMRIGWDGVVGAQFGYISGATRLGGFAFPSSGSGIPWSYDGTSAKDGIMDFGATPFAHFGDVYAKNYSMLGTAARSVIVERHTTADTAGVSLTVQAGGCTAAAVDKPGGTLYLAGGISQDTGGSSIELQTATPGAAASGDHNPSTKVTITGPGVMSLGVGRLQCIGATVPLSGAGCEVGTDASGYGVVNAFDRTGGTYLIQRVNGLELRLENSGTEYVRLAGGHLICPTDNTVDIGASGATRPRTLYLGTSLYVGANKVVGPREADPGTAASSPTVAGGGVGATWGATYTAAEQALGNALSNTITSHATDLANLKTAVDNLITDRDRTRTVLKNHGLMA